MAERQAHGFKYEQDVVSRFGLIKAEGYTNKDDAYYKQTPVQVKCIKKGSSIDLGDYFRNASKNDDFILIIGFWEGSKSNIVEEYALYIDHNKWNKLLRYEFVGSMFEQMKLIRNDKLDDDVWKTFRETHKLQYNYGYDRKIQLRFKRDHKSQKRIQCAINKTDFYDYFLTTFSRVDIN